MNAEDRALAVLARANPVPNTDSLKLEGDTVTYLATLQQRSREMTELNERTRTQTRWSPPQFRWTWVAGLSIAVIAVITMTSLTSDNANNPAGTAGLTQADFVGTWTAPQEGISALFVYFDDNGRYALSDSFGAFEDRIIESGDWTFDGEEFVFTTDDDSSTCAGTVGHYTAQRVDDERIQLTPITPDPCTERQVGIALGPYLSYPLDPDFSNR